MTLITIILAIETVILLLTVVLVALTHFRDQLIGLGWLPDHWSIVRMAAAAERTKVQRILKEIGFREDDFQGVATSSDTIQLKRRYGADTSLSQRLLFELKPWTLKLEPGFSYGASGQYYVDTMGAMSFASAGPTSLSALLDEWVRTLVDREIIPPFDIVLVLKDGNVAMARQFLALNSPSGQRIGILCKGVQDRSRVGRVEQQKPHYTDFEGLRAFLETAGQPQFPFNAIAVDDNCTGGSSLCYAMRAFNDLVAARGYPIRRVEHAVVLFNVKSVKTASNFQNGGFGLHAVLSLGHDEMPELVAREPKDIDIETFRVGFGCEWSRTLRM